VELAQLASNLRASGSVRWAELEGRKHAIVPVVMAGVGVLNGSKGPLFYPAEEHEKTASDWNGKPIVVYHAELDGREVSAASPEIFERQRVGVIFNARWESGKLRADAWIDEAKANVVDPRVMRTILTNSVMEVSTGLKVDVRNESGDYGGTPYDGIAVNYRPDHLALLPDQIGAYSIADGGGFCRNAEFSQFVANTDEQTPLGIPSWDDEGSTKTKRPKLVANEDGQEPLGLPLWDEYEKEEEEDDTSPPGHVVEDEQEPLGLPAWE